MKKLPKIPKEEPLSDDEIAALEDALEDGFRKTGHHVAVPLEAHSLGKVHEANPLGFDKEFRLHHAISDQTAWKVPEFVTLLGKKIPTGANDNINFTCPFGINTGRLDQFFMERSKIRRARLQRVRDALMAFFSKATEDEAALKGMSEQQVIEWFGFKASSGTHETKESKEKLVRYFNDLCRYMEYEALPEKHPYSMRWFEWQIRSKLDDVHRLEKSIQTFLIEPKSLSIQDSVELSMAVSMLMKEASILGRMVEHYKWKFKFEETIVREKERKAKASAGSGVDAKAKRFARLDAYMSEIENFRDVVGRMDEGAILEQAFKNAAANNKGFWKLGSGQAHRYAQMLVEELDFKNRYRAVFSKRA